MAKELRYNPKTALRPRTPRNNLEFQALRSGDIFMALLASPAGSIPGTCYFGAYAVSAGDTEEGKHFIVQPNGCRELFDVLALPTYVPDFYDKSTIGAAGIDVVFHKDNPDLRIEEVDASHPLFTPILSSIRLASLRYEAGRPLRDSHPFAN